MTVRFPTSDAYWNLRAEQVMNKVFETPVFESRDLEPVEVAVHESAPVPPPPLQQPHPPSPPVRTSNGMLGLLTVVAVTGIVSSGWLLSHWLSSRDQLAQERSLLMLERLRSSTAPQPAEASAKLSPSAPEPTWMDELQSLPLTPVPPIPPGPLPQLTGVVQGPGGNSSAIFQLGASSLSAGLGEAIGSSGWVLESVHESGAVIRRNGQRHTLAVGGMF